MKSFFCLACSHIPFSLLLSIEGANVNERMLEPYTAYLAGDPDPIQSNDTQFSSQCCIEAD
jgi:hypothetical protein